MILQVKNLEVFYGEVPAVRGVDLELSEGEAFAVLGRNGAGKTSLLRAIAGAIGASDGNVLYDGTDVTSEGPEKRVRRGIALVPEGRHIFPDLTVRENLAMGAYHRKYRGARLRAEIESVTTHMPVLRERFAQPAGTLSGGEQQLVAIARAMLAQPRLLLVDEPSLGLAPIMVDRIYDLFRSLRQEGLTLLIVEQYVDVALGYADRAMVIDKGRVALSGTAGDLRGSHDVIDTYLSATSEANQ
jgi:branched-chain amino acid transport system ATP-binding protein